MADSTSLKKINGRKSGERKMSLSDNSKPSANVIGFLLSYSSAFQAFPMSRGQVRGAVMN